MNAFIPPQIIHRPLTMVSCQHFLSGIGQYGYQLSKRLADNYDLSLFKPFKAGYADAHYHQLDWVNSVYYRSLGPLHPYLMPAFLAHALPWKASKDSIFHAHWFLSGLALSYIKKRFIITMHDVSLLHVQERSSRYTDYYRWAINRFRKKEIPIIVVSNTAKADAIQHANYPEHLVHAIYNGIDFKRFYPKKTTKRNQPFRIVYAGGLGNRKNLGLLLEAFALLEKKYVDIELLIAGAFPERSPYPALANELGIKKVYFTDFLPDYQMGNFYREGDLMIYPSLYEGFGFAPLEAMACGTPVLCARGGALQEISGGGAISFDYKTEDLFEKACYLIDNKAVRENISNEGIAWVQQFSWEKTAQQTSKIYEQL